MAGNRLFQSYLNMSENPQVGLLFLIPGSNDTVRVNGRVTILAKEELDRMKVELSLNNPDDNSKKLQGILVEVDEAYTHCPRALKFAELWNPDAYDSTVFHNRDLVARARKEEEVGVREQGQRRWADGGRGIGACRRTSWAAIRCS